METVAFWKTMNKQTKFSSNLRRLVLAGMTAATLGPGVGNTRAQGQTQSGLDRIPVTLSGAARPAHVKVSMVNGGITVNAVERKEWICERPSAHPHKSPHDG